MSARDEPTAMKGLREDFRTALTERFRALKGELRTTVGYENDALRLKQTPGPQALAGGADDIQPSRGFDFRTDAQAKDEFLDWLDRQTERGILEPIERPQIRNGEHYTGRYIRSATERGNEFAARKLREAGYDVPDGQAEQIFNRPLPQETLEALYTRTFDNLETVTQDMRTELRRELTQGFSQGWNPQKTAKMLNKRVDVSIADAERLARTETMHAHNTAAQRRYEQYGVEKVVVINHSPCPEICAPVVGGNPYKLSEVPDGGPPLHPNCVGALAPVTKAS
jgi:SPP1 gp7 family putative phage head morphogenesis protein